MGAGALEFKPVHGDHLVAARRIVSGAFLDEQYAYGQYGRSAVDRFVGLMANYASWPSNPSAVVLGAWSDDVLLAVAGGTPPGACSYCEAWTGHAPPGDDLAAALEMEFRENCRAAHSNARLGPHAHISVVATEPVVRGAGVGGVLVREMTSHLVRDADAPVVLECFPTRVPFYERLGFHDIGCFIDPAAPDPAVRVMRLDPR